MELRRHPDVEVLAGIGVPEERVTGPGSAQPVSDVLREFLFFPGRYDPVDHDHDEAEQEKRDSDPEQPGPVVLVARV